MENIFNKFNLLWGGFIAVMTMIFGKYWIVFVGFLILNTLDFYTGRTKARKQNNLSTKRGKEGIQKKVHLWILVALGFMSSWIFTELGNALGLNLGFTIAIGYMVLGALIINEFDSIIENLVECGVEVPGILTKGLKVAKDILNSKEEN